MNRHQRRKRALVRKEQKAQILLSRALCVLQEERTKRNLANPHRPKGSVRGMGNRGIYQGYALYPAPGYGSGTFKEKPLSERTLRQMRAENRG